MVIGRNFPVGQHQTHLLKYGSGAESTTIRWSAPYPNEWGLGLVGSRSNDQVRFKGGTFPKSPGVCVELLTLEGCILTSSNNNEWSLKGPQKSHYYIFLFIALIRLTNDRPGLMMQKERGQRGGWILVTVSWGFRTINSPTLSYRKIEFKTRRDSHEFCRKWISKCIVIQKWGK